MDLEDRAYVVYVATQRWLAVRLDAVGALLILAVALLVVRALPRFFLLLIRCSQKLIYLFISFYVCRLQAIGPSGISPSQVGLLLTYTVSLVQMFGMLTRLVRTSSSSFGLCISLVPSP
jgi:ATP-binding cassette subfamily C (CFTR/MRP) protein 1